MVVKRKKERTHQEIKGGDLPGGRSPRKQLCQDEARIREIIPLEVEIDRRVTG